MDLIFTYTDRRLPPNRTITVSAAKVHSLLLRGLPMKLEDEDAYRTWCDAEGVECALAPEPEAKPAEPVDVPTPNGAMDGWPDTAEVTRSGAYYTVTMGDVTFKERGKSKAQEAAWALA